MGRPANADGDEESFASAVFQDRGKLGVDGGGGEESGGWCHDPVASAFI